jgi:hypothetical protein
MEGHNHSTDNRTQTIINQLALPSDSGYGTAPHMPEHNANSEKTDTRTKSRNQNPLIYGEYNDNLSLADSDSDDARTEYTDAGSLSDLKVESYVATFAEDLPNRLKLDPSNEGLISAISTTLSGLLRALALKLGFGPPLQSHRDVMVFIHRYRG